MKQKFYPFKASEDYLHFWFESQSEERIIAKAVELVSIGEDTFNLAFGDLDEDGEINDLCVSNNHDMKMVLATVIQAVLTFFEAYPENRIYFTGSSPARTRLYTAVLTKEFENWQTVFEVIGTQGGELFPFERGVTFEGFIINKKLI